MGHPLFLRWVDALRAASHLLYLVSSRPFPIGFGFCKFSVPSCYPGQREGFPFLSGIHVSAGR